MCGYVTSIFSFFLVLIWFVFFFLSLFFYPFFRSGGRYWWGAGGAQKGGSCRVNVAEPKLHVGDRRTQQAEEAARRSEDIQRYMRERRSGTTSMRMPCRREKKKSVNFIVLGDLATGLQDVLLALGWVVAWVQSLELCVFYISVLLWWRRKFDPIAMPRFVVFLLSFEVQYVSTCVPFMVSFQTLRLCLVGCFP